MAHSVKQWLWQVRGLVIVVPLLTGLVLGLRSLGVLQPWEWAMFDLYMQVRPPEPQDDRIVIVGITERDIQAIGKGGIFSDAIYAQVIEKLRSHAPRAIGLDVFRDLPVEPGHQQLINLFETTPNLIGIRKVVGEIGQTAIAAPPALAQLGQVGANDAVVDDDNVLRRGLLSLTDTDGNDVPALSFYLALLYLEAEGIEPQVNATTGTWSLGGAQFPALDANAGGYVGADVGGHQILVNYRGAHPRFAQVSLIDVLEDRLPPDWAHQRIVLIGGVARSLQDVVYTPYSRSMWKPQTVMAGVEFHAHLTSQILSAALDNRPQFRTWTEAWESLWITLWVLLGAGLTWQYRHRRQWLLWSVCAAAGLLVLLGSTLIAFFLGWWLPVLPALLALTGGSTAVIGYIAHLAGNLRRTLGRYLNDEIVAELLETPEGLELGGERRHIVILTSDLRGFTAFTEQHPPEAVVQVLNFYLGAMTEVIDQYQGIIDEFMGDGILVMFGMPMAKANDTRRAVACALEMQLAMAGVNQQLQDWGFAPLEMGIGIHRGEVIVGNIGSERRSKYSMIGRAVNLTYRIESFTIGGEILISEAVFQDAGTGVQSLEPRQVHPKGVAQPITIYPVVGLDAGLDGGPPLVLPQESEVFVSLDRPLPIQLFALVGKQVEGDGINAQVLRLSAKGAWVQVDAPIHPLDNFQMVWRGPLQAADDGASPPPAAMANTVYAKVIEVAPNGAGCLRFTSAAPQLLQQYHQLQG